MKRWLLIATALGISCGGSDARIGFAVPAELASLAKSVRVRVVRPTSGDATFDCEAVAFGEVTAERLDGATEREVVIDATGPTELGELTRNNRTLLVAEAFDSAAAVGARVAAGCVDREAIEGGDAIRIDGVPAVELVGLDPSLASGISVPPADVPSPLELTASDARGIAVAGVVARMHVLDTSGAPLTIERTSNSAGAVAFETTFLAERPVGAVRLVFRSPWQRAPLSIDTASPPRLVTADFAGNFIGAVPAGTGGVYVAFFEDIDIAALRRITVVDDELALGSSTTLPIGFRMLLRVPSSPTEIIAGIWNDATYRVLNPVTGAFGAPASLDVGVVSGSERVLPLPACGAAASALALIDPDVSGLAVVAVQTLGAGLATADLPPFVGTDEVTLRAAGCIADDGGALHRAVAVRTIAGDEVLRIEGVGAALALPASLGAVRLGAESDPRLLVGVQTTSGPQVRAYTLGGPATARRLEPGDATPLGGNARELAAVDLDGNAGVDIAAVISAGSPSQSSITVLYRGLAVDPPLSALFALPALGGNQPVPEVSLDRDGTILLPLDADGDGRVELWAFRSYVDTPTVTGPGPLPPGPPESHITVHRLDFGR